MEIAMKDGQILMRNMDTMQYTIVRDTGKCRWDKKKQLMIGPADIDVLNTLNRIIKLPPKIAEERNRLQKILTALDDERMEDEPVALVHYPVKLPLFNHQIRGANMALLAFGVVDPPERKNKCATCEHMGYPIGCEIALKYGAEDVKSKSNVQDDGKVVDCKYYRKKKKEGGNNGQDD